MKTFYLTLTLFISLFTETTLGQCLGYELSISYYNPTCNGFCDGNINFSTTGGNGPETFVITNSSNDTLFIVMLGKTNMMLCADWYYVTATDSLGCTVTDSVELIEPGLITPTINYNELLCSYDTTGWISVDTVINTQGNYYNTNYYWNPDLAGVSGTGGDSIYNLNGGTYILSINDDFGCSEIFTIEMGPEPLEILEWGFEPCVDGQNGIVYGSVTGGTPDYTYTWTNLGDMSTVNNIAWGGLSAGDYEFEVIDSNGCILTDTLTLGCVGIDENILGFNLYPNPSSGKFTIKLPNSETSYISIYTIKGDLIYKAEANTSLIDVDLGSMDAGLYMVTVQGNFGFVFKQVLLK